MSSNAEQQRDYRARKKVQLVESRAGRPFEPIDHGSRNGAAQHRRRGERPCDPCRLKENEVRRQYRHAAP